LKRHLVQRRETKKNTQCLTEELDRYYWLPAASPGAVQNMCHSPKYSVPAHHGQSLAHAEEHPSTSFPYAILDTVAQLKNVTVLISKVS
jgi:hypothetical protein